MIYGLSPGIVDGETSGGHEQDNILLAAAFFWRNSLHLWNRLTNGQSYSNLINKNYTSNQFLVGLHFLYPKDELLFHDNAHTKIYIVAIVSRVIG